MATRGDNRNENLKWYDKAVCKRILKSYFFVKDVEILSYEEVSEEIYHATIRVKGKTHGVVYTGSDQRPAVFMDSMIFIGKPQLICDEPDLFLTGIFETTISGVHGTQIVRVK